MPDKSQSTIDYTNLNIERGITAPLVRLPETETLMGLKRALPLLEINKKQLNMINKIIMLCQQTGDEPIVSFNQISHAMGISVPSIRKHAKSLLSLGIFKELHCTTDPKNKRRGLLYEFTVPDFSVTQDKVAPAQHEQTRATIKFEDIDLVSNSDLSDFPFSDLVTSVLFGALRFNQKSSLTKINSQVVWGFERVAVESRSGKGERIAQLKDLRYYIATITVLESIIRERIINREEITETYNIPLNSILGVISIPKTGRNKEQALVAIRRLSGTSFHIKKLPNWFLKKYEMSSNSVLHLNIFTLRIEGESLNVPGSIVLQLQFPAETIAQIRRRLRETSAIHDLTEIHHNALSAGTNNLAFAFSLWTSAYFYERNLKIIGWGELKDRTAPQFTLTEFKKSFSKVLSNYSTPATVANDDGVEVIDEDFVPIYKNGIAIRETASILGVKVALDAEEFVLMPEINLESPKIQRLIRF